MAQLILWDNAIWREFRRFSYTGGPEEFTLSNGTYLVACHGAQGGVNGRNPTSPVYGGSAYGILRITEPQKMYAYVGGNGENGLESKTTFPANEGGSGGFNGGGHGGKAYMSHSSTKYQGAGGGGATDIRLHKPEEFAPEDDPIMIPTLPAGYVQVEYLDTSTTTGAYFDTGYIAQESSTFVFGASFSEETSSLQNTMPILGSSLEKVDDQNVSPGWVIWLTGNKTWGTYGDTKIPQISSVYGSSMPETSYDVTTVPFGEKAIYRVDKYGVFVNGNPINYTYDPSGVPRSDATMLLFALRRGNNIPSNRWFGKFYFLQIYEEVNGEQTLVHEFIPCVKTSNNEIGLYDTVGETFIRTANTNTSNTTSYAYLNAGNKGPHYIPGHYLKPRYFPKIPEGYQQLKYVKLLHHAYFDTGFEDVHTNTIFTIKWAQHRGYHGPSDDSPDVIAGLFGSYLDGQGWLDEGPQRASVLMDGSYRAGEAGPYRPGGDESPPTGWTGGGWYASIKYDGEIKIESIFGSTHRSSSYNRWYSTGYYLDMPVEYTFRMKNIFANTHYLYGIIGPDDRIGSNVQVQRPITIGAVRMFTNDFDDIDPSVNRGIVLCQSSVQPDTDGGSLYYFKIYETLGVLPQKVPPYSPLTKLMREYIPCKRLSDDAIGLYETQEGVFIEPSIFSTTPGSEPGVLAGPEGTYPLQNFDGFPYYEHLDLGYNEDELKDPDERAHLDFGRFYDLLEYYEKMSLNSRLIVAGGGGGGSGFPTTAKTSAEPITAANASDKIDNYGGIGGGAIAGFVVTPDDFQDNIYTRGSGYMFGNGSDAVPKTTGNTFSMHGAGGGGGGWYGGNAINYSDSDDIWTSANGGGGDGFVYGGRSPSVPYGEYSPDESFKLTNTLLTSGTAIDPEIIIYTKTSVVNENDVLFQPPTGKPESAMFPAGKYMIECYGGDGGVGGDLNKSKRGGYAKGTLNLTEPTELFLSVGGDGLFDSLTPTTDDETEHGKPEYFMSEFRPHFGFNGGGMQSNWKYTTLKGHSGGGATDVRIKEYSVMTRVIVAGGAGGESAASVGTEGSTGGAGGGTTGATPGGSRGTNAGAGTQNTAPQSDDYPDINGYFGYGGYASEITGSTGKFGGAGGGGWFGGSGTYPNGNYTSGFKGGAGGSGYVFTESSYKPEGFLLKEKYYLENTTLTQGGNNLPRYHTGIRITVLETRILSLLCRDKYGIKYYDSYTDTWRLTPNQELTPAEFRDWGSVEITNDNGLDDEYEVLVYDPSDMVSTLSLYVTPNKQIVTHHLQTDTKIKYVNVDLDCDPELYEVVVKYKRSSESGQPIITTRVELDKLVRDAEYQPHLFYITYSE